MIGRTPRGGSWLELRRAEGDDLGEQSDSGGAEPNESVGSDAVCRVFLATGDRQAASLLEIDEPKRYSPLIARATPNVVDLGCPFKRRRKGVQRQGSQQIAAHSPLDFSESLGSAVDPGKVCGLRQLL